MAVSKSSLSAGEMIYAVLTESPEVMSRAGKVYPIVEDSSELPYIVYRRISLEKDPTKTDRGADTVKIQIQCFTQGYTEGVELAEAVRDALDGVRIEHDGMVMRRCDLEDSEEMWIDDARVQVLIFNCKI